MRAEQPAHGPDMKTPGAEIAGRCEFGFSGLPYDDDMAWMGFGLGFGVATGATSIKEHAAEEIVARPQEPVGPLRQDFDDRRRRRGRKKPHYAKPPLRGRSHTWW